MNQDVRATRDRRVLGSEKVPTEASVKGDMRESVRLSSRSRNGEDVRVEIDSNNRTGGAYQLCGYSETSPAPQPRSRTRMPLSIPAFRSRRSVIGRRIAACSMRRRISS